MRIVHCADVHIGMEPSVNRKRGRTRKSEILQGFLRVVDYCGKTGADILLISGDLFDSERLEEDTVTQIKEAFAAIPQVDIYIAPGNHDPITASSPYSQPGWSENVTIFGGAPGIIERPDRGYRIWGFGFESCFAEGRPLLGVRMPEDDLINLGILHGQLTGRNGKSIYNTITDSDIEKSGLDYLALGHVHKQTQIMQLGKTFYAYSGTIEGQGFDEEGVKGFYAGEITKEKLAQNQLPLEYVSLSKRRYYHQTVNVTGAQGRKEITERILSVINELEHPEDNLYKITLTGSVEQTVRVEDIQAELDAQLYYVKVKDDTVLAVDYETLAQENSLKGMFTARMLEQIADCEARGKEKEASGYRKALELGIRAFYGEVGIDED